MVEEFYGKISRSGSNLSGTKWRIKLKPFITASKRIKELTSSS